MSGPNYEISYLTGVQVLEPIKYHIGEVKIARWWWGHRTEYAVVSDFMTLGGFKTRDEAHGAGRACGLEWVGGL